MAPVTWHHALATDEPSTQIQHNRTVKTRKARVIHLSHVHQKHIIIFETLQKDAFFGVFCTLTHTL